MRPYSLTPREPTMASGLSQALSAGACPRPHRHSGAAQSLRAHKSPTCSGHSVLSGPISQYRPSAVACDQIASASVWGIGQQSPSPLSCRSCQGISLTPKSWCMTAKLVSRSCRRVCHPSKDLRKVVNARESARSPHRAAPVTNHSSSRLAAIGRCHCMRSGIHEALEYIADSTLHASSAPLSVANIKASALSVQ